MRWVCFRHVLKWLIWFLQRLSFREDVRQNLKHNILTEFHPKFSKIRFYFFLLSKLIIARNILKWDEILHSFKGIEYWNVLIVMILRMYWKSTLFSHEWETQNNGENQIFRKRFILNLVCVLRATGHLSLMALILS